MFYKAICVLVCVVYVYAESNQDFCEQSCELIQNNVGQLINQLIEQLNWQIDFTTCMEQCLDEITSLLKTKREPANAQYMKSLHCKFCYWLIN